MRLVAAERRKRHGRWGRGQHHRNVERDGGDAEQAAAGFVVPVAAVGVPRNAVVRKTAIGVTVDSAVAMPVYFAVPMRLGYGFRRMDVSRDRRVIKARRTGAERHGRMRGKDAKRVDEGERQRRREPAPPDRFENPCHSRFVVLRRCALRKIIQGPAAIANRLSPRC